jgi:putative membrane protein
MYLKLLLKGALVGIANIIPGVSGGTVALVLGIYERLLAAINTINIEFVKDFLLCFTFKKSRITSFIEKFKKNDMVFIMVLGIGAFVTIVATSKLMTYLLQNYHEPTYGFFFGLILFSIVIPYKLLKRKSIREFVSALVALIIIVSIGNILSSEQKVENAREKHAIKQAAISKKMDTTTKSSLIKVQMVSPGRGLYLFISGFVAISAMILPGISGSFLLLLFGVYFDVLRAITERDIVIVSIFSIGCILGILLFTRFLEWILKRFYNETIAFLLGLIVGSLYELWPFKNTAIVGEKTIYLSNLIPSDFNTGVVYTLITFLIGSAIVLGFTIFESKKAA